MTDTLSAHPVAEDRDPRPASFWARLRPVFGRRLAGKLAVALTVAAIASGLATYLQLSSGEISQRPNVVLLLLYLDLVLLLLLAALVAAQQKARVAAGVAEGHPVAAAATATAATAAAAVPLLPRH